jgi:hypothetical protein
MQVMTYQASSTTLVLVAPQLAWDAVWLAILVAGSLGETRVHTVVGGESLELPTSSV